MDCVKRGTTFGDRASLELNIEDADDLSEEETEDELQGDEVSAAGFPIFSSPAKNPSQLTTTPRLGHWAYGGRVAAAQYPGHEEAPT